MTNGDDIAQPVGQEAASEAEAGEPRESGPDATREAIESPAPYRLPEDQLDDKDEQFSGPRKPQGPPLGGASDDEALGEMDEVAEDVDETPPPEVAPEG